MLRIPRDVILFGPPGVGKGAQAAFLSEDGRRRLSMGDVLREEAASGSKLGEQIRELIDEGRFAADDVACEIVEARLLQANGESFVLDGFPRNVAQAERLEAMLARLGRSIDRVIFINAPEQTLLERLTGRLVCYACERSFHKIFRRPRQEGLCDGCGGELSRRRDDRPDIQRERLQNYCRVTEPLVEYYRERGLLEEIDGSGSVRQTFSQIRGRLVRS